MMPSEVSESATGSLLVGAGFMLIGSVFMGAALLFALLAPQIILLPFGCAGAAVGSLGWVILTREPRSVALRPDGIQLEFLFGRAERIAWDARKRFAVLTLPGIGPLLGRVSQYTTALDEQDPRQPPAAPCRGST